MKKIRDTKEIRRNNPNFFKYMQPAIIPNTALNQKSHARSMVQLGPNIRYQQQSARQTSNNNKQNHHSSLCNHIQSQQLQNIKSKSLKKFLGLFGSNQNNNYILNNSTNLKKSGRQQKKVIPNSSRQVFTCNIKNMSVNMTNSKQKDPLRENKTNYVVKKDRLLQNNSFLMNNGRKDEQEKMTALKKLVQDYKIRQKGLKVRVQQLQTQNKQLKKQLEIIIQQKCIFQQNYQNRERQLQLKCKNAEKKNEMLEKSLKKDKCKEHELIIESLKKVINEQLRKIIQLQKSKIQRQQIQKLQERINQNMLINSENIKDEDKMGKSYQIEEPILIKRKQSHQIKIQDQSFDSSAYSFPNETHLYQSIEEVNEQQEESNCKANRHEDTILQEVDKYLSQWRNKY